MDLGENAVHGHLKPLNERALWHGSSFLIPALEESSGWETEGFHDVLRGECGESLQPPAGLTLARVSMSLAVNTTASFPAAMLTV